MACDGECKNPVMKWQENQKNKVLPAESRTSSSFRRTRKDNPIDSILYGMDRQEKPHMSALGTGLHSGADASAGKGESCHKHKQCASQPQIHLSHSEKKASIHENYQVPEKIFQCSSLWGGNVKYAWVLESDTERPVHLSSATEHSPYTLLTGGYRGWKLSAFSGAPDKTLSAVIQAKPSWPGLRKSCSSDTCRNPGANQSSLGLVFPTRLCGFWADC